MVQTQEQCDGTANCSVTCQITSITSCGNGTLQIGEECDDGNLRDIDGCTSLCRIEQDYCKDNTACIKGKCASGIACDTSSCGDGILQTALNEQCDDGNSVNTDDCSNTCTWVALAECGDGVVQPETELCDNGNQNSYDPNAECRLNCIPQKCGDGIVDDFIEECDDGNNLNGDGCSYVCTSPSGAAPPSGLNAGVIPPYGQDGTPNYQGNIPTPARTPTGPGLVIFLASGAAAGVGIVRRRFMARK